MIKTVSVSQLKTRPPFSSLFPIQSDVLDAITGDIRDGGYDESKPIDVWSGQGVVVDGHTRLKASIAAGLRDVPVFEHEFSDEMGALAYAIHNQRDRRNMGADEILNCVAAVDQTRRLAAGGDRRSEGFKASRDALNPPKSATQTAAIVGVSQATVERSRVILADPAARQAVEQGMSINAAYKQAQERKRDQDRHEEETVALFPTAAKTNGQAPPVLTLTPIEDALRLAKVPGAFTVAEWAGLDAKTKHLLIEEAPLLGGDKTFNRTNENVDWAWWTWNPVTGCLHDCEYCYARDIANRFYPQGFVPAFVPARLHAPRYSKVPAKVATDYREANAFTCSMADLFGKWVPQEWIDAVFAEAVRARDWRFLFLTKFPRKLAEQEWPENAWVGTSVDKQFRVEIAEKSFRDVTAGVKWLSCEPLLERLTFTSLEMFDWVVIGGESPNSHNRAGFDPPWEWIDHLYRQALDAGCRVYFKENLRNRPKELPAVLD